MRIVLLPAALLVSLCVCAQHAEISGAKPQSRPVDSVRNAHIQRFPDYFFVYPVLKQHSLNFELENADRSALLTYKPNNTYSLGLGVYLFEVGLQLAYAIPLAEQSIERYGESVARDFQLNAFAGRWGADAFYQRYSGFYLTDRDREPASGQPYPSRRDIATRNFGVTGHYLFNYRKFSFRSAYNFAERQRYSSGSFIMLAAVNSFRVGADSSIVSEERAADFGPDTDFTRVRYTTVSIAPGYTYNLTYHSFFLNATLAFGPASHWVNYGLEGDNKTRRDRTINTFFGSRVAIGYNGDRIFGGISFNSQGSSLKFQNVRFANNNSVFKMLIGYRFREFGILRKRAVDLLPFRI